MEGIIYAQQIAGTNSRPTALRSGIVAINSITAFTVITSTGTPADSTNVFHKNKIAGIATDDCLPGFVCNAIDQGEIENPAWGWTRGDIIYLNGTNLSTIMPSTGFRVVIGQAISTTKILVGISESILL